MKPDEKISPAQALDNLYKVTRSMPADANMHEFFARCRDVLQAVITPKPKVGSNATQDHLVGKDVGEQSLPVTTPEVNKDEKHDGN